VSRKPGKGSGGKAVAAPRALLPPPLPDASRKISSLGRWVDNLLGDARIRRAVDQELAPLFIPEEEFSDPPSMSPRL
jgi:hypothetical protein